MLIEVLKPHVRGKGEVRGPEVRTLLGTEQKQEGECGRGRVAKKMGSEGWREHRGTCSRVWILL